MYLFTMDLAADLADNSAVDSAVGSGVDLAVDLAADSAAHVWHLLLLVICFQNTPLQNNVKTSLSSLFYFGPS